MSRDSRKGGELLGGSMMDAIQYQGKVYIAEPDVRKAVNAALATNEERDRRISELEAKLATRSEITPLERYALAVLDAHREEIGDLDGAFLQDKAEACGLLESVPVKEPCGELCRCAEYDDFPQECLRLKAEFEPKMAAMRLGERERG